MTRLFTGLGLPPWDPSLPLGGQLLVCCWSWCTATRLRRLVGLPLMIQTVVIAAALLFPAQADAAFGPRSPLMQALGVADSYGVPLSQYAFSTDYGSVLDGGSQAVLATIIEAEAGIFVCIGGFAIWFLCYVVSFGFLPDLVRPVAAVAQNYAGHIIPGVGAIAALVASLVVAINVMRGHTTRAASQGLAALVVAMVAAALVYSPISWVISNDGPLIQGRNVAVSLGANSVAGSANTAATINRLEGLLATSFVRRPLQTFNFAGQPDATASCANAWSAGVRSGDPDRIKDGIRDCGAPDSGAMKATADHPNPGQLGTGLLLIVFSLIFALFCLVLGLHIVAEFFRAIANCVRLLWGFAVGVIPGGPQSSLVNTFVAVWFSGIAMFAYIAMTMFIGEIVTAVFASAGNGIVAMFSALLLMVIAIGAVFTVSRKLKSGSSATAAGILSSVGSPPAPASTNIVAQKSSAFLHTVAGIGGGLAATAVGAGIASRVPALANSLELAAVHVPGNRLVRNLNRGIYTYNKTNPTASSPTSGRNDGDDDGDPPAPPHGGPAPTPPPPPPAPAAPPFAPSPARTPSPPLAPIATPSAATPPAPAPPAAPSAGPSPAYPETSAPSTRLVGTHLVPAPQHPDTPPNSPLTSANGIAPRSAPATGSAAPLPERPTPAPPDSVPTIPNATPQTPPTSGDDMSRPLAASPSPFEPPQATPPQTPITSHTEPLPPAPERHRHDTHHPGPEL